MLKRMLAMALVAGLGIWVVSSCNGSNTKTTTPANGTVVTFVSDVPFCGMVNFHATITGLGLRVQGTNEVAQVFGTPAARQPFYKVPFGKMRDFSALLDVGSIAAGTYDQARVTFETADIITFDPTQTPPINTVGATLSTTSPLVSINPPLVIASGGVTGLHVDFNIQKSITLDPQGQILPRMTPVMSVTPMTASATTGFGELDDLNGFVTSVLTSSTGAGFAGGFGLQTLSGSGPLIIANLTNSTQVCGLVTPPGPAGSNNPGDPDGHCVPLVPASGPPPVQLNQLPTGSFISLDGYVDLHGNLVATTAEVEDREVLEQNHLGFIGTVVPNSITKDANGNVSQFNLYISESEPDSEFNVAEDSTVVVNLSSSTLFQFSGRTTNFGGLSFDATSIKEGQELVVHGVFNKPATASPTTVAADKVYLKLQAHQGSFSSLVAAQADDKTGAFWLTSCSTLFESSPILVLTNGPGGVLIGGTKVNPINFVQSTFVNMTGLSALTPQPELLVKGLLFYDLQGGVVNGVTVPPGTLVLLAKQVHQLD